MYGAYEGLPAAASVQQAVSLAQLEILRRLERQRTGAAPAGALSGRARPGLTGRAIDLTG